MRRANEERLLLGSSDSKQIKAPVQKKMSVAPKLRAHSTLQYTTPTPAAPRGLTTADPGQIRQ